VEEIDDIEREGFEGLVFFIMQNHSHLGGNQKLYWMRVLGGLHEL